MKKLAKFSAFMVAAMFAATSFTSCGTDDVVDDLISLDEQIDFTGLNVVAQPDGKVLIDGQIKANTKIKKLVLSRDADGDDVIVDLLKNGDQEKVKALDEQGNKNVSFTAYIPTVAVEIEEMYIYGKTKGEKKAASKLTETLEYKIGAANSTTSSYLSVIKNKAYNIDGAKANAADVEVIANSSSDGNTVEGIKRASAAKSSEINSKCGKVALYQNGTSASVIKDGGVIVTESGAICKVISIQTESGSTDATFKGITMKNGLVKNVTVDVSKCAPFSK
ncbi:MAG: hypothetical protein IKQ70_05260 [Bacteroidales bacterium]|nr:hypothetical protein [Bacteroidales bacterium]